MCLLQFLASSYLTSYPSDNKPSTSLSIEGICKDIFRQNKFSFLPVIVLYCCIALYCCHLASEGSFRTLKNDAYQAVYWSFLWI